LKLTELGLEAREEDVPEIVKRVKELSEEKGRSISDDEFRTIVEEVSGGPKGEEASP
jgi:isopropylmalate/homocitrate/citramalate synthase